MIATSARPCLLCSRGLPAFRQVLAQRHNSSQSLGRAGVLERLRTRGLVKTVTSDKVDALLREQRVSFYCGVDPTAPSLHLGNLLTLLPSLHLVLAGHEAFALVGGATGRVGDPAGRSSERDAIQRRAIEHNLTRLKTQLDRFFHNGVAYARSRGLLENAAGLGTWRVVNNSEWYDDLKFMDFMHVAGRNVRISSMLARDSVKHRLASSEGMSFGEFVYQLLQAYDFWHLFKEHGVRLQIGGSDQYGNITAGVDLIGRLVTTEQAPNVDAKEAYGLTVPLLTTPSGEKFGKSAGNAIWLDPDMTSPFDLYQYFVNSPDEQVEQYLRLFSLLPAERISELDRLRRMSPASRTVQHALANEVLTLIHGAEEAQRVTTACRLFFPNDFATEDGNLAARLNAAAVLSAFRGDRCWRQLSRSEVVDQPVTSLLRVMNLVKSGKEARQLILNGGVYARTERIVDPVARVRQDWLLDGRVLVLRVGKNKFSVIELCDD